MQAVVAPLGRGSGVGWCRPRQPGADQASMRCGARCRTPGSGTVGKTMAADGSRGQREGAGAVSGALVTGQPVGVRGRCTRACVARSRCAHGRSRPRPGSRGSRSLRRTASGTAGPRPRRERDRAPHRRRQPENAAGRRPAPTMTGARVAGVRPARPAPATSPPLPPRTSRCWPARAAGPPDRR